MANKLIKDTNAYRNLKKKCDKEELALLDYITYLDEKVYRLFEIIKNNSEQFSNMHDFMEMQNQINDMFAYKLGLERDDQDRTTDGPVEGDNGADNSVVSDDGL